LKFSEKILKLLHAAHSRITLIIQEITKCNQLTAKLFTVASLK